MGNTQQQQQPQATLDVPAALTTSGAKLIYLYLRSEEEATIDELHRTLGMTKLSLYPLLQTLTARDLVKWTGITYVCQEPTVNGETA